MFDPYTLLKWLHILGACVLMGTGAGIAFFMLMAHLSRSVSGIANTTRIVVIADYLFTLSAVVAQPITGYLLARTVGWSLSEGWIAVSLFLYVCIGTLWLPVVWMQSQMRDLATSADQTGSQLPKRYYRLFRLWVAFGVPAFAMLLVIFWLMIAKPALDLF